MTWKERIFRRKKNNTQSILKIHTLKRRFESRKSPRWFAQMWCHFFPTSIRFISFWLPITVSLCLFKSIIIAPDSSSLWIKTAIHKLLQLKHNGYCIWKAEKWKKTQIKSQCKTEQRKAVKNMFSFKGITGAQIDSYSEFRAFSLVF